MSTLAWSKKRRPHALNTRSSIWSIGRGAVQSAGNGGELRCLTSVSGKSEDFGHGPYSRHDPAGDHRFGTLAFAGAEMINIARFSALTSSSQL
jgi:hypothetical protein